MPSGLYIFECLCLNYIILCTCGISNRWNVLSTFWIIEMLLCLCNQFFASMPGIIYHMQSIKLPSQRPKNYLRVIFCLFAQKGIFHIDGHSAVPLLYLPWSEVSGLDMSGSKMLKWINFDILYCMSILYCKLLLKNRSRLLEYTVHFNYLSAK